MTFSKQLFEKDYDKILNNTQFQVESTYIKIISIFTIFRMKCHSELVIIQNINYRNLIKKEIYDFHKGLMQFTTSVSSVIIFHTERQN